MEIKDLAGLSKPLEKLIDSVSGAIGKLYQPTHELRMAKADAESLEIISEAISKNISLPINYEGNNFSIDTTSAKDLVIRTQNRMLYQEMRKQQNIESVVEIAYEELKNEIKINPEPVDEDWIIRFFNSVEDIGNEEMQIIWGKILAAEIKQPKSFSNRTLAILKNLSPDEAKLFEKISKFTLSTNNKSFLANYDELRNEDKINYNDIIKLNECGLIESSGLLSLTMSIPVLGATIFSNGNEQIFGKNVKNTSKTFSVHAFPMTTVGTEISKIFNQRVSNKYFYSLAKILSKVDSDITILVKKLVIEGLTMRFENVDYNK